MPQNIFKIFDGRTNFWQWDTRQKLIVLDDRITEVRFSNRNMEHSKRRPVYTDNDGLRICNVPDLLLQLPKNLIAYACIKQDDGTCSTVKAVKFAVFKQPIPTDYICEQDAIVEDILTRIELLENLLKDVAAGAAEMKKFNSMVEAAQWAKEDGKAGDIVVIKLEVGWVPHIVEDDRSLSAICNCDGDELVIHFDGEDADGIDADNEETVLYFDGNYSSEEDDVVQYFDGGSAFGVK